MLSLLALITLYQYLDYGAQNYIFARLVWNIIQMMHASDLIFYYHDLIFQNDVMHFIERQPNITKTTL